MQENLLKIRHFEKGLSKSLDFTIKFTVALLNIYGSVKYILHSQIF